MIGKDVELLLTLSFAGASQKTLMHYCQSSFSPLPELDYQMAVVDNPLPAIHNLNRAAWQRGKKRAKAEIAQAQKLGISFISYPDPEYPINLCFLPDAPIFLYVQGNYRALNHQRMVAVIGTRTPSPAGAKIDQKFTKILVRDGFVTVAGLAQGCDTYAHRTTIDNGGQTIAIMGASLEQPVFPPENKDLAKKIITSGGALVSSFPFGTKLSKPNFAVRDEWQCGVSDGVLAIETMVHGGTRIAMHHAFLERRPLAVVDYRQSEKKKLTKLPTFQGNLDSLRREGAIPLYSTASLKNFEKKMMVNRKRRLGNS